MDAGRLTDFEREKWAQGAVELRSGCWSWGAAERPGGAGLTGRVLIGSGSRWRAQEVAAVAGDGGF
jgi:hypothetical protein